MTATRDRILDVAAALFADRGYAGTSTRDIATAVGIRQPGLYKHFASKQDILRALFHQVLDDPQRWSDLLGAYAAPPEVKLYAWLSAVAEHLSQHPLALGSIYQTPELELPAFATELEQLATGSDFVARLVEEAVAAAVFHHGNPKTAAALVLQLLDTVVTEPDAVRPDDVVRFAFAALLTDRRDIDAISRAAADLRTALDLVTSA